MQSIFPDKCPFFIGVVSASHGLPTFGHAVSDLMLSYVL